MGPIALRPSPNPSHPVKVDAGQWAGHSGALKIAVALRSGQAAGEGLGWLAWCCAGVAQHASEQGFSALALLFPKPASQPPADPPIVVLPSRSGHPAFAPAGQRPPASWHARHPARGWGAPPCRCCPAPAAAGMGARTHRRQHFSSCRSGRVVAWSSRAACSSAAGGRPSTNACSKAGHAGTATLDEKSWPPKSYCCVRNVAMPASLSAAIRQGAQARGGVERTAGLGKHPPCSRRLCGSGWERPSPCWGRCPRALTARRPAHSNVEPKLGLMRDGLQGADVEAAIGAQRGLHHVVGDPPVGKAEGW